VMNVQQHYQEVSERGKHPHMSYSVAYYVCYLLQCMGQRECEQISGAALQIYVKTTV
jgi:hypothetical protein